jgi:hypothetical protein
MTLLLGGCMHDFFDKPAPLFIGKFYSHSFFRYFYSFLSEPLQNTTYTQQPLQNSIQVDLLPQLRELWPVRPHVHTCAPPPIQMQTYL